MRQNFCGIKKFVLSLMCEVSTWNFTKCIYYLKCVGVYSQSIKLSNWDLLYSNFCIHRKCFLLLIFGLFRFILKPICLLRLLRSTVLVCFGSFWSKSVRFGCFNIHFRFDLVHLETNRNKIFIGFENEPKKRETDPVSVRTYFFYFVRGHPFSVSHAGYLYRWGQSSEGCTPPPPHLHNTNSDK